MRSTLPTVISILSCSLFFLASSNAQTVTGIVIDSFTKEPVPFASVYFSNSSRGTSAGEDGRFELYVAENGGQNITISSVGYASQLIENFEPGKIYHVYLEPHATLLDEFQVVADDMPRKEKEEMFLRDFLGESAIAKKCRIENLDDVRLVYFESEKALVAICRKPLIIINPSLGYRITYYLDNYRQDPSRIFYQGHSIFKDETSKLKGSRKRVIARQRQRAYYGSRMHFFRVLWSGTLKRSKFRIEEPFMSNKIDIQTMITTNSKDVKHLNSRMPLLIKYTGKKESKLMPAQSDGTLFTKDGFSDPTGHSWLGGMAEQRIGDLLPFDYVPK